MPIQTPKIAPTLIVADDAQIAARLSCHFALPGHYLPVIDGPRMDRPDHAAEVARRNNLAARLQPDRVLIGSISDRAHDALLEMLPKRLVTRLRGDEDLASLPHATPLNAEPMKWGQGNLALGLLRALRLKSRIVFEDGPSPADALPSLSGHVVVCEASNDLSEVIAANYAYALKAGLHMINRVEASEAEAMLERFYSLYDSEESPATLLSQLRSDLRSLCGNLVIPVGGSLTFISSGLPFGFAFPEHPSTHLRRYPDLGRVVVNGFAAEQVGARGVNVAVLVDPETTEAPEIAAAAEVFARRRMFVRGYQGGAANVKDVSEMIEHFPYDLLLIATHCGDTGGWRHTYNFKDRGGNERCLVTDVAIGVGHTRQEDILHVTEFTRFVALDGVDWHDPQKAEKLTVGTAISDFMALVNGEKLEPSERKDLERVVGSAALRMFDNNFIALPTSIADETTPIIVNNACASWHELSERFVFGNCRLYVGTLFPITTTEAHDVVLRVLTRHHDKPLPHAFWSAQNDVYGESDRRPYVCSGVYTQRLRHTPEDVPRYIWRRLLEARSKRRAMLATEKNPKLADRIKEILAFLEEQLDHFRKTYELQ